MAIRRHCENKNNSKKGYLDKVTFFEYTNLPGIINDRFFSTFAGSKDDQICEEAFVNGFCKVYLSSIEEKLKLTFDM